MNSTHRRARLSVAALAACLATACTTYVQAPPQRVVIQPPAPAPAAVVPAGAVSVVIDPPIDQPPPIAIAYAPPPMLVEVPTPMPYAGAVWVGGYWTWQGDWVWAHARWMPPPFPGYGWVQPYYENRGGSVVFITGHWAAPGVAFVPPAIGLSIATANVRVGITLGAAPIGPPGVFVPAPPGSRLGLIVPAPIGTSPAVVTSAPPIVNVGMVVRHNTTNITNVTNISNVTNVTNVSIVAPPGSTASGHAYNGTVPAQAHLAAALPPVVRAAAPAPRSMVPQPAYVHGADGNRPAAAAAVSRPAPVASPQPAPPMAPPPPPPPTARAQAVPQAPAAAASRPAAAAAPASAHRAQEAAAHAQREAAKAAQHQAAAKAAHEREKEGERRQHEPER